MKSDYVMFSIFFHLVKREMRDRLSGAVEAFARRKGSSSGANLRGDHLRHRSSDNVPSSKDMVRLKFTY